MQEYKYTHKQHAIVFSPYFNSGGKEAGVAVVVSPPGNVYNAVVAAVHIHNAQHSANLFCADVEETCRIIWGELEPTEYGRKMLLTSCAIGKGHRIFIPEPDELVCGCVIGPDQYECPHGTRRHED